MRWFSAKAAKLEPDTHTCLGLTGIAVRAPQQETSFINFAIESPGHRASVSTAFNFPSPKSVDITSDRSPILVPMLGCAPFRQRAPDRHHLCNERHIITHDGGIDNLAPTNIVITRVDLRV